MSDRRPNPQFIKIDPLGGSAIRGLFTRDPTQYLLITKLSIKQFLEECLRAKGQFRPFFDKFANYTIGFEVNRTLSDDPNQRAVEIAAFFSQARMYPPQMFIQDGGYDYKPLSLGGLSAGWNVRNQFGDQIVRIEDAVMIPITITCAALDEQEIENMISFLSMAFGQYQVFLNRWLLAPRERDGIYWEIRLPYKHSVGAKTHAPLHDDPEKQLWQVTFSMTVDFENSSYLRYQAAPQFSPADVELTVTAPSVVSIRSNSPVSISNRTDPIQVYSDDPRVAIVKPCGNDYEIEPRRIGTFNLLVARAIGREEGARILHTQSISVTPNG